MARRRGRRNRQYRPNYGTYDPGLDQQERSAGRGLGDLLEDIQRGNERAIADYGIGRDEIARAASRGTEDIFRGQQNAQGDYQESLSNLLRQRGQTTEGYQLNLQQLGRQYERLGNSQRQQQNATGTGLGGAGRQAAQKRTENYGHDRQPLDMSYRHAMADSAAAEGGLSRSLARYMEDSGIGLNRFNEDVRSNLGQLLLGTQRGWEDRTVAGRRAQRENVEFGLDINELRIDQAQQAGLLPPMGAPRGGNQNPNNNPVVNPNRRRRGRARTLPGLRYGRPRL